MTTWHVGDPVVVLPNANNRGGCTTTVTNVGRKYFTIESKYGRDRKFSLEDGFEQGDSAGGYCRAVTPEQAVDRVVRDTAYARMHALTNGYSWHTTLTVAEMDAISAIVEVANARKVRPQ